MKGMKKILIVDDDEVSNFVSEQMIKRTNSGFEISAVHNGLEAMMYFQTNSEDLPAYVLLDIDMPVMNGIEFLNWLSSSTYSGHSKIIMYTNSLLQQELEKTNPFTDVMARIEKPISAQGIHQLFEA